MGDLPAGWTDTTLGDLGEWSGGGTPSKQRPEFWKSGTIPWVSPKDMKSDRLVSAEDRITPAAISSSATQLLPSGCVLVVTRSGILSRTLPVAINDVPVALNQDIKALRPNGATSSDFVRYFLRSNEKAILEECKKDGTTVASVNTKALQGFPCRLPPINEQRRIVKKLDAIFKTSRSSKARVERLPALLENLKRSILAAAFRGDLTSEWRKANPGVESASLLLERIRAERYRQWEAGLRTKGKDPRKATHEEPAPVDASGLARLPRGWAWARWDEIGDCQNGRAFPSAEYSNEGVRLLRPGNLHVSGRVVWTDENTRCMPARWAVKEADAIVGGGELVINLTAQSLKDEFLGRICMTSDGERCLLNQRIARLTPTTIDSRFLLWLFKSPLVRGYIDQLNTGSLIQHMFTSQIARFVLPIPPLVEQRAIVALIEGLFAKIESSLRAVDAVRDRFDRLERAALAKAFSGELVPHDPTDEPAIVVLERIRASGAHEPEVRRRRPAARTELTDGPGTAEAAPLELVVAAFQNAERLTASAIGDATGLDAIGVKKALKALVAGGLIRVEGKGRGAGYVRNA